MHLKVWRRERDSNPRYPFRYSGFQDRLIKPLSHPSALCLQPLQMVTEDLVPFSYDTPSQLAINQGP